MMRRLVLTCLWLLIAVPVAFADSTGIHYAGQCVDSSASGSVTWTVPSNAQAAPDGVLTTATGTGPAGSHGVLCSGYNFSIPAGSTITGVTVSTRRYGSSISDSYVFLNTTTLVGNTGGTNEDWGNTLITVDKTGDAGGNPLWGTTLTATLVNLSSFGVYYSAAFNGTNVTAYIDSIGITVTYTLPANSPTPSITPTTTQTPTPTANPATPTRLPTNPGGTPQRCGASGP